VTVTVNPVSRSPVAVVSIREVSGAASRDRGTYQLPRLRLHRQAFAFRTGADPSPRAIPATRVPSAAVWLITRSLPVWVSSDIVAPFMVGAGD